MVGLLRGLWVRKQTIFTFYYFTHYFMRPIYIIKQGGYKELWDPQKVERSLRAARADEAVIGEVMKRLDAEVKDDMSTKDIYRLAFGILRKIHRPTAAQYSLKNAIMELGPSGFPFEKFFAEILKGEGFHTQVGVIVKGACVDHEVDVIAERDGERYLVEAKYHNSPSVKTDVKVALYVHARFLDIEKQLEKSAAGVGYYNQPWIITNTSFTTQAIQYGSCAGLRMTGWNYPKGNTLQDMIQHTQTHPITSLTTLTRGQKNAIITKGYVLCRDILEQPKILEDIGVVKGRLNATIEEATHLCHPDVQAQK